MFTTNKSVTIHKYGVDKPNSINSMSSASASRDYYETQKQKELLKEASRDVAIQESNTRSNKLNQIVFEQKMYEQQLIHRIAEVSEKGKTILFKQIMTEMFAAALLLDEEFVTEHYSALEESVGEYIDENGGFKMLENACKETKSPWLNDLKQLCIETSRTVAQRKLSSPPTEDSNGVKYINFDLDETEKDEFDYEKSKLNLDQLSELVKNKTLTVIQDEKNRQDKDAQVERDLEDHYNKLQDEGKDVAKEQSAWKALNGSLVKESTLFDSIFKSTATEAFQLAGRTTKPVKESMVSGMKLSIRGKEVLRQIKQLNVASTGDYVKLRPLLLKLVSIAESNKELDYLRKDLNRGAKKFQKMLDKNPKHEHAKEIKEHLEWLKKSYMKSIDVKASTLDNIKQVKPTTESIYLLKKLNESVASMMASVDDDFEDEDADTLRIDTDEDDIQDDEYEDTTLRDEMERHSSSEEDFDLELESIKENKVDMDLVFAETITKYTMLELFHTVRLEQFSVTKLQNMSRTLLN